MFAINDKRVAMSDLWPLFKSLITWKCQIVALVVLILFIGKDIFHWKNNPLIAVSFITLTRLLSFIYTITIYCSSNDYTI